MIFAIAGALYLFYIYGCIAKNNSERIALAVKGSQSGEDTIQVQELPYKDYVWCSDVEKEPWSARFKLFYGIDKRNSAQYFLGRQSGKTAEKRNFLGRFLRSCMDRRKDGKSADLSG